ncbi:MAG: zinc ribbon domain-containing protein [Akkermansiaceae bacterium]|nr:zinc ribbon domain-containing protein [Akkermansiaceae bacterium]NNM29973.1 zinc ribbon domain-containing protein [Akkermansiaceae bacterium]
MPTYDYVCEKCGHAFEHFQSMNDPKLTDCPLEECDGTVKRLLGTGAGIIFKGGGFYETDYRSDSYKQGAKGESESAKPKKDKADAKKSAGSGSGESGGSGDSGGGKSSSTPAE